MGRIRRDDNKFFWEIKDFPTLQSKEIIYSDEFAIGGCKWRLMAYPMGDRVKKHMALYLDVADSKQLPSGWKRRARFYLEVINRRWNQHSEKKRKYMWFDQKTPAAGYSKMIPHSKLFDEEGFVVDGEVMIAVTIDVYKVVGKVDDVVELSEEGSEEGAEEESEEECEEEESSPLKKTKLNDDGAKSNDSLNKTQQVKESIDVNGFQVLPSQVEFVRRIFEKHPDMALEFRAKNQHLRTASMNVLLSLIETLCQSSQELSNEDLVEGDNALSYVIDAGFKVDWLEKQLEEVKEKKEEEQTGETRIQELEEEIKGIEQKLLDMKALLEKEKAKVSAARVSLTLDDIV